MKIGIVIEIPDSLPIVEAERFAKQVTEFAENLKDSLNDNDEDVSFILEGVDKLPKYKEHKQAELWKK